MDRTLMGQARPQMRGGTFVVSGATGDPLTVGAEPLIIGRRAGCHLVLEDRKVSATHCEVMATGRGVRLRDLGSTNGTYVGEVRVVEALLDQAATVRCGDTELEFEPGGVERVAVSKASKFGRLVGTTPIMRALFEQLGTVAPTTLSVLIEGETGTGKELVAQAIHEASDRAGQPFEIVDCAAIPPNLAESYLFGHEKGAFTGAVAARPSPFVLGNRGTVFLDELGELPLELQPKLLRVLQEQRIKSVGSRSYVPINVRVVCATRRDLLEEINRGAFRDDLFFRIAQARITVPPLRERLGDIAPLVRYMMEQAGKASTFRRVSAEAIDRLERHDWPGNVRELQNLVSLALAYDKGRGRLDLASHLAEPGSSNARIRTPSDRARPDLSYSESRAQHDRAYFGALYKATDGNVGEMSRRAQLDRETVREKLKVLRIGRFKDGP